MLKELSKELDKNSNPEKAKILQGFFKTGKGEYGEGQIFLGIDTPTKRKIAKQYSDLNLIEIKKLLESNIHDKKFIALIILEDRYKKGDEKIKKDVFDFYLKNIEYINNWDLIDISCYKIIGDYIIDKKRDILYDLIKSKNLWKKRIAVISCYAFIKKNDFKDIIKISEKLLEDKHDLIHKAIGWMLREVGNRNKNILIKFLNKNYNKMPRTMLRYSIEKFPEKERKKWLNKKYK